MELRQGFRLNELRVLPLDGRIVDGARDARVQPKSMDVLLALAAQSGAVVERDALLNTVWAGRAMTDEPLTRCIGELRRALGDDSRAPTYIETVPKRGYRLLISPQPLTSPSDTKVAPMARESTSTPPSGASRGRSSQALVAAVLLAVLLFSVFFGTRQTTTTAPERSSVNTAPVAQDQSVAILPLRNVSGDATQSFFGAGLAAELTAMLARNPALRVASQIGSEQFASLGGSAREIAAALGVAHLVEGTARLDGERAVVTVNLVDPVSGHVQWSERFDEPLTDLFAVQERIARRVASSLEVSVVAAPDSAYRTSPQAYMLYLEGRYAVREGNADSLERAIERFREALAIDATFAPAWAALAGVRSSQAGRGFVDWKEGFESARTAAQKAIDAAPSYAGGHAELAWVAHRFDGDLAAAFASMNAALASNPFDIDVLADAAVLLLQTGQLADAVHVLRFCIRRAPTDPRLRHNLGVALKYADELDAALEQFRYLEAHHPDYAGVAQQIAEVSLLAGRAGDAARIWETFDGYNRLKGLAIVRHVQGDLAASAALTRELVENWQHKWPSSIADVYAYTGNADEAFRWLDVDFEQYGSAGWGEIKLQRWYDPLRGDPRWEALVERVGFSEEAMAQYRLTLALPGR